MTPKFFVMPSTQNHQFTEKEINPLVSLDEWEEAVLERYPVAGEPAKTKEEIEAINAANAKKDSPTSRDSQISTIKGLPTSQNVTIIYPLNNGQTKTVDMGTKFPSARAKPTKKEMDKQFKIGASWVEGNLTNTNSGFVKMPNGTIYEISSSFRSARIVKE